MKKLSRIMESIWSDMQDRGSGDAVKKEDKPWASFELDGKKYILSQNVEYLSDEYLEENDGDDWNCFGFNHSTDKVIIDEVQFSFRDYDLDEDNYDTYVLRDFFDMSKSNWELRKDYILKKIIDEGYINYMPIPEVKEILLDFTRRIIDDNHLSEYAAYQIFQLMGNDYGENYAIYVNVDPEYVPDDTEFPDEYIEDEHNIMFPMFDNWGDELRDKLIEVYEKLGWTKSEEHELDPYESPNYTESLVFVKLKEGYVPGEDDEDEDEEDEDY